MKIDRRSIVQLVRFGIVGSLNTLIDIGVLNMLLSLDKANGTAHYFLWKTISFICALLNSFFLNKHFTFRVSGRISHSQVLRFTLITALGFFANVIIPSILVSILSLHTALSGVVIANIAALIGVGISLLINFFGYKYVVFT